MGERERQVAKVADMRRRADEIEARRRPTLDDMGVPRGGQPILVGHHSEKAHRRTIDRAHRAADRELADYREAERLRRDACALEAMTARDIFDDDPDAIERLGRRIAVHEHTVRKLKDGAIPSMGPLERKDQIAGVRRKIRADRKRIETLNCTNAERSTARQKGDSE